MQDLLGLLEALLIVDMYMPCLQRQAIPLSQPLKQIYMSTNYMSDASRHRSLSPCRSVLIFLRPFTIITAFQTIKHGPVQARRIGDTHDNVKGELDSQLETWGLCCNIEPLDAGHRVDLVPSNLPLSHLTTSL